MKLYPKDIYDKLEFTKVLQLIAAECLGEDGKKAIFNNEVYTDQSIIERKLDETNEWLQSILTSDSIPFGSYENIENDLYLLSKENYVLEVEAIQRIHWTIQLGYQLVVYFKDYARQKKYPSLYTICEIITIEPQLSKEIIRIFDEEGEVRPDASANLLKISKSISNKEKELDKAFRVEVTKYGKLSYLTENLESVRSGRRVLTVAAEHKRKIRGVIHDESGTGKMVYIEPEETIIINNEIFNLHTERRTEIYKILRDLCNFIRPFRHDILAVSNIMVTLDVIRSKALFAKAIDGERPQLIGKPKLALTAAKNPILHLKLLKNKEEVVPFDLELFKPNRLLVLSGPNAGGKSVTMKTVGLLQLMVQSGMLVSVDANSKFGIFKEIYVDIGDQQSLEDDLSTYSSHLNNMKAILDNVGKESLVLIDEFGSGTDPKIGGAIAEAILHEINYKKAFGVITTHYSNLKHYAYKMNGLLNGSMEFDKKGLKPTYQLIVGRPGSSFAFEIAQKTGLPEKVISNAKKKAGKNENALEEMLVELQTERREIELKMTILLEKEEKIDKLVKNYNTLHADLEYQKKKIKLEKKEASLYKTDAENRELQALIKELRQAKDLEKAEALAKSQKQEKEGIRTVVNSLKQEVFETIKVHEGEIKEGSFVRVRNTDSVGKIIKIEKDKVELEMGFLKVFVDKKDLLPANEPIEIHRKKSVDTSQVSGIGGKVETKLDIRGYKLDDAMWFVEEFIERAIMNNAFELQIIHGIGNGILKKNVHKKLKEYKSISKYWHPEDDYGGQGVTLVQI